MASLLSDGRIDLFLELESDGLVVTANCHVDGSAGGPLLDHVRADEAWESAIGAGAFLPLRLEASDPRVVRVVLGPLADAEETEWVGRVAGRLEVPDGALVVSAGADLLRGDLDEEALARVDVPPDSYLITLYAHLPGVNGEACVRRAEETAGVEEEPLGAYFRRTCDEDEPFPDWLAVTCAQFPDCDPGHEDAWEAFTESERFTHLVEEAEALGLGLVDVLVHLAPWVDDEDFQPPALEDGWLREIEVRKPACCPKGLQAKGLFGGTTLALSED